MNEWEWRLLEDGAPFDRLAIGEAEVKVGDRVRLRPKQGGDVLDIALAGQVATVESIEQDYEGKAHVCVVLDQDPGSDLGLLRQPGHRFFFDFGEVEPLPEEMGRSGAIARRPSILVAGIGNIFLGDDGYGVEVVQQLQSRSLPAGVRVADFGIRGFDLAYAMQDGYETVILVDAFPHGQTPGTVSLIEPDISRLNDLPPETFEGHTMNPLNVWRMATTMDNRAKSGRPKQIFLVGCEPATLGGEDGRMELSEAVRAAVEPAIEMIEHLVGGILEKQHN
ncbi:MAG TPA: hydrogenase maturation protease [Candidatus Solibacter sp.]|nr:hydrogenase maturation protease [Candidatus Solibacter sp.]